VVKLVNEVEPTQPKSMKVCSYREANLTQGMSSLLGDLASLPRDLETGPL